MANEELKPCPFCNIEDDFYVYYDPDDPDDVAYVECTFCYCCGPHKPTRSDAIAAWNHRQPDTGLVEALEKILEDAIDGDENGMCMYYSIKLEVNDLLAKYRSKE